MIDSHCHLADDAFASDLPEAIQRARAARIDRAICILAAGDEVEADRAALVAKAWPGLRFAAGVHPHNAASFSDAPSRAADAAKAYAQRFGVCAIGEIGLDYHYDLSPRPIQREVFAAQVSLAQRLKLPIVIHTREATDDTFEVLREAGDVSGVFHCFTGDAAMAARAVDIGFYVSFAGIVTFPKAEAIREAARLVPGERILVETDSPYLAPVPHRGQRNEPAFVAHVLQAVAAARGGDVAALEEQVTANFDRLFGTNQGPAMA